MADALIYATTAQVVSFLNARRGPNDSDWTAAINDGITLMSQEEVDNQVESNSLPMIETGLKIDPTIISTFQRERLVRAVAYQAREHVLQPASAFEGGKSFFSSDALQELADAHLAIPIINSPLQAGQALLQGDLAGQLAYGEYRSVGAPYFETGSEPWYPSAK